MIVTDGRRPPAIGPPSQARVRLKFRSNSIELNLWDEVTQNCASELAVFSDSKLKASYIVSLFRPRGLVNIRILQ